MNLVDKNILFHLAKEHLTNIQFSRIFLSATVSSEALKTAIFSEIFYLLFHCHQTKVATLYASATPNKSIYLITLQFKDQSLANIMVDFTNQRQQHIRKIEIVSDNSIYNFDSSTEDAFYSDYILNGNYIPDYEQENPYDQQIKELLLGIDTSITNNSFITFDQQGGH
ncbi:hypothetical protein [uncultured Vagococcus sp.]|uniref:hypothetical protein n=1 Tax=uncultured Vagococcus sp. TaxID=189676 RepID=UPI0028D8CD5B|nr:hypothetical protein [uncultured Vagococcus sp.]